MRQRRSRRAIRERRKNRRSGRSRSGTPVALRKDQWLRPWRDIRRSGRWLQAGGNHVLPLRNGCSGAARSGRYRCCPGPWLSWAGAWSGRSSPTGSARSSAGRWHHGAMTSSRQLVSSGSPLEPEIGLSRAVRSGSYVCVAGTAPIAEGGGVAAPGDVYGQSVRCLDIAEQALQEAGA